MGKWLNELLVKFILTGKFKVFINERLPLKTNPAKDGIFDFPIFHHSSIPCVRQKLRPRKTPVFLVSCTISEPSIMMAKENSR